MFPLHHWVNLNFFIFQKKSIPSNFKISWYKFIVNISVLSFSFLIYFCVFSLFFLTSLIYFISLFSKYWLLGLVNVLQGESPVYSILSDQVGPNLGFHLSSPGCGMNSTAPLEDADSGIGFTEKTYRGQGESTGEKAGVPLHEPERGLWVSCSWSAASVFLSSGRTSSGHGLPGYQVKEGKQLFGGETNRMLDARLSGFGAVPSAVSAARHLESLSLTPTHGRPWESH